MSTILLFDVHMECEQEKAQYACVMVHRTKFTVNFQNEGSFYVLKKLIFFSQFFLWTDFDLSFIDSEFDCRI